MTCEQAWEYMSAALDGELTLEEKAQLDHHLAQCDSCRALYGELAALHDACGGLEVTPPPALKEQIMGNLPPQIPKKAAKAVPIHWKRWGAMAASLAVIALAAWQLPRFFFTPPAASDLAPANTEAVTADVQTAAGSAVPNDADPAASGNDTVILTTSGALDTVEGRNGSDISETRTFLGDTAITTEDEFNATFDVALNGASETADPAPTSLPDYLDGVPVDVNAAPAARASGGGSTAAKTKSAKLADAVTYDMKLASTGSAVYDSGFDDAETPDEASMELASFRAVVNGEDEILEPLPEMAADEIMAATLFLDAETPRYCGVLTLSGGAAALSGYPAQMAENGEARYELPGAAFRALVNELTEEGVSFELRMTGEDISAAGQTGLVIVLP